jgi:hypothetical protein
MLCGEYQWGANGWGANEEQREDEGTIQKRDKHKERQSGRHMTWVEEQSEAKEKTMLNQRSTGFGFGGAKEDRNKHRERRSNRHMTRVEDQSERKEKTMLSQLHTGFGSGGAKEDQRQDEETFQQWNKHKEQRSNRHITWVEEQSDAKETTMLSQCYTGFGFSYNEERGEYQWGANEEQRQDEEAFQNWDVTRIEELSEANSKTMLSQLYTGWGLLYAGCGFSSNEESGIKKEQQRQDEEMIQKWGKHKERQTKGLVKKIEEDNKALTKNMRAAQKELIEQDKIIIHLATELVLKKAELDNAANQIGLLQKRLDIAVIALDDTATKESEPCMAGIWNCIFD